MRCRRQAPAGQEIQSPQAGAAQHRPLRILLAEDNRVNQMLAVALLGKDGHDVTVACDGKAALDALAEGSFDVVLMDVQMPRMGGLEATARIREAERSTGGHLPIVAMTAHAMAGDRRRCLDAGMDGYVTKPIDRAKLVQALREALGLVEPEAMEQP